MAYTLRTVDGKYSRVLSNEEFRTLLKLALKHGWRPAPRHLHHGSLRMSEPFSLAEGKALAAAMERGLQREQAALSPLIVMAVFESIAVLRRSDAQFLPST
ncbi:MAG: hypothetical protein HC884_11655 [Chloroflexaceae bacterium]|nr:hypothetical protein [Chloroflexaceae bacterium]